MKVSVVEHKATQSRVFGAELLFYFERQLIIIKTAA